MGKAWYPLSGDARWSRVGPRLAALFAVFSVLRYVLVAHDPRMSDWHWTTLLLMHLGFPLTMFVMVLGIAFVVMYPFWKGKQESFPGLSHAFNMTLTPMAVLCALMLITEMNSPLWQ